VNSAGPLLLAVDTSGADAGLVLAGDGFTDVRRLPVSPGGQARTEDLADLAAGLLSARGLAPRQLGVLAAVTGPGSYTGLRSGLAFLRGLAFADSLPAVSVGSLELLAWRGAAPGETVAAWWPAGSGRAMVAAYRREDDGLDEVEAPRVVEEGEELRLHGDATVLIAAAALPEAVEAAARAAGLGVRVPLADPLVELAGLARAKVTAGRTTDAAEVLPLYVGQSTARPNRHRVAVAESPAEPRE